MPETVDFLSPRLVGARFDGHAIPLEVLKDLSVLDELIVEVAKWHYKQENPRRKRIPKGFADEVSLKITAIEDGSAIPKIVLAITAMSSTLFPVDHREYFEKARESIVAAVDSAERQQPVAGMLSDNHFAYFDRIGRTLRDGESLELNFPDAQRPARLNKVTRRYLTLAASSAQGYTEEVRLRGRVCAADQEKERFDLRLIDGSRIAGPVQPEHLETIVEAFREYKKGVRVIVEGVGKYDRRSRLVGLDSIEHISLLDAMDVGARLDEFRPLKNGWFEGKGIAPPTEGLDWLTDQFESNYSDELPTPYFYPTGEGGVQAEWTFSDWEVSLDIDLEAKAGYWHALNHKTDEDREYALNLKTLDDWKWIADQMAELLGGSNP